MLRRWGAASITVLALATGCGAEVQREANVYDYAAGYLSGRNENQGGAEKGPGCVQQLQDYEAAMDEGAISEVRKYFMKGCMDGFDGTSPAMWPEDQPKP